MGHFSNLPVSKVTLKVQQSLCEHLPSSPQETTCHLVKECTFFPSHRQLQLLDNACYDITRNRFIQEKKNVNRRTKLVAAKSLSFFYCTAVKLMFLNLQQPFVISNGQFQFYNRAIALIKASSLPDWLPSSTF